MRTERLLGVTKLFYNWLWWLLHNPVNTLKTSEPYTLHEWIVWCVNSTLTKLVLKKEEEGELKGRGVWWQQFTDACGVGRGLRGWFKDGARVPLSDCGGSWRLQNWMARAVCLEAGQSVTGAQDIRPEVLRWDVSSQQSQLGVSNAGHSPFYWTAQTPGWGPGGV